MHNTNNSFKIVNLIYLLGFLLFVTSCQKDLELETVKENPNLTTSNRNDCNNCPNFIVNGDFEDVCSQSINHFTTFGCVEGDWTNVFGTADVRQDALYGLYGLKNIDDEIIFESESVVTNTPLRAGIEYCLDFDSYFRGLTESSDISLWQVCFLATDNLQENTNKETPCSLNDPFFLVFNEPMYCRDLLIGQELTWLDHSTSFTLTQDHTQIWPLLLPRFDLEDFANSYSNTLLIDNIYLSCESKLFNEIEAEQTGSCAFQFTPISDEAFPGNLIEASWDFGDGNFSNELMPTHQFADDGPHTVTLSYKDHNGCCNTIEIIVECEEITTSDDNCIVELCWNDYAGLFDCLKAIELTFNDGTPPLIIDVGDIPTNQGYANIEAALIHVLNESGIDYTFTQQHPLGPEFDCYKGQDPNALPGWYVQSDVLEQFTFLGGKCGEEISTSVSSTNDNCEPCFMELCWNDYAGHFKCLNSITVRFSDGTTETVIFPPILVPGGYANTADALQAVLDGLGVNYEFSSVHPDGPDQGCVKGNQILPGFYLTIFDVEGITFNGSACGNPNQNQGSVSMMCEE